MPFWRRLFGRPAATNPEFDKVWQKLEAASKLTSGLTEAEKPYWISFYGGKSISEVRRNARNSLYQSDCPNPDELLSECYVVSEGRRFVPDDDYCTKPNDMIFFPRVAAALSGWASRRGSS